LKRNYKLILVAGARPNFMKIAPIIRELKARSSKLKDRTGQSKDQSQKLKAHPGEIRSAVLTELHGVKSSKLEEKRLKIKAQSDPQITQTCPQRSRLRVI